MKQTLDTLREKGQTHENLMPYIMDAVRSYASVGEITKVLKDIFGEFKEPVKF